jgi:hypothetical protein
MNRRIADAPLVEISMPIPRLFMGWTIGDSLTYDSQAA